MILISVQNIQKSFGIQAVLKDITFSLQTGEKMGLVGANGCGKTTLIRMIAGETTADAGQIHKNKNLPIGYLAQIDAINPECTVWEAILEVFEEVIAISKRLTEVEQALAHSKDEAETLRLSNEYQRLTDKFNDKQGYAYQGEMLRVLQGLGLPESLHHRKVGTLSGGERTRLALAKLLLQKPEVLLMDEPTNHLDLAAIEWLQDYLIQYTGSLLLVSHDRYFLDKVCNTMGEILGGKIMKFTGNYSTYQKKRAIDVEARLKAYSLQQKEIEREMAIIARYKSFNREKSIKAAESRQKRLDKVERLDRPQEENTVRMSFMPRRRSGEVALEVSNLEKRFEDKQLFKNLNFKMRTGDRVALIGSNGVGKSTLFRILLKQLHADNGQISYGTNIDMGYYDQHQQALNLHNTVLEELRQAHPTLDQTKIRNVLALFLFSGDDVFTEINKLSGGERGRVALAKLMLQNDNFLLLDEPTNHLDMDSCEVLEDALEDFDGTLLAISHDRYFINRFANRIIVLSPEGATEYLGNFDDYLAVRNRVVMPTQNNDPQPTKTFQEKERKRERQFSAKCRQLQAVVKKWESAIEDSEKRLADLEYKITLPDICADANKLREVSEAYQNEQHEMEKLYENLELAEQELEDLTNEK